MSDVTYIIPTLKAALARFPGGLEQSQEEIQQRSDACTRTTTHDPLDLGLFSTALSTCNILSIRYDS